MENQSRASFFSEHSIRAVPWMVIGKTLSFFIYFAISVIIVRSLTVHQYGEYSLCKAIAEYLVKVVALGLNISLLRFIPELVVTRNLAGIKSLLKKTAYLQLALLITFTLLLYLMKSTLSSWLKIDVNHFTLLLCLVALASTVRNFGNDVSTAIYQSRFLTILSLSHALLWLVLLVLLLREGYAVEGVLVSTAIAGLVIGCWNAVRVIRHFKALEWDHSGHGIGKKRVLGIALPMMVNDIINLLIMNYTEIFFLGYFFTPTLVGYYDVGYQLSLLALTFLPLALQSLFFSAFSEAYTKDSTCLPDLVFGYFQILILITVPIACFGSMFSYSIVEVVYGEKMLPAAFAVSIFAIFHMITQFSIPPSMAINAMEKTVKTLWFGAFEFCVAIVLDLLLIPKFGLEGAIGAAVGAFVLTLPVRIRLIQKLTGGVYFPGSFFLRVLLLCVCIAYILYVAMPWIIPGKPLLQLLCAAASYFILVIAGAKVLKIFRHKDFERFRSIGIRPLNRALDFFSGHQA